MIAESVRAVAKEARTEKHFVYVLDADNHIKIGFSFDPWQRVRQIANAVPFARIELITVIKGSERTERALHVLLAEHNFKGDWFYKTEQTIAAATALLEFHVAEKPESLEPSSKETFKKRVDEFRKHELSLA